jgi:hypothetical protein
MAASEVEARTERAAMSDCLHCDINELVQQHIDKGGDAVDVGELAARMAESLAELILFAVPEEQQVKLVAQTLAHFGDMLLEKSGAGEGDTTH